MGGSARPGGTMANKAPTAQMLGGKAAATWQRVEDNTFYHSAELIQPYLLRYSYTD